MNSPEDDIPLPSDPILSEEETLKQLRADSVRQYTERIQTLDAKDRIKTNEINVLVKENRMLYVALEESIKLQSFYAELLNMHDGGARKPFNGSSDWIARLKETGTIK